MDAKSNDDRTSIRRLERLLEASRLLNSTLQIRDLAEIVLQLIRDEIAVDRCTLFVVDRKEKLVRSFLAHGANEFQITLPVGEGLAGLVALTGQPLDVPDAYADSRFRRDIDQALGYRTNDVLCLPVQNTEGNLIGVLQLLNRRQPITDQDKEFLTSMCTYLGLALHNAWLHRELEESRKAEHQLRGVADRIAQAEKLSALAEMLAGMVHEMKNPLTVAIGNCFLVREEVNVPATVRARVETINLAIGRSLKVAENFMRFVRGSAGAEPMPADINALIRQTVDLLQPEFQRNKIGLVLDLEEVPMITVDGGSIQQVMLNLLRNAQQATEDRDLQATIQVASFFDAQKNAIIIEVTDNGAGIPESARSQIFEPFFTTKAPGVGNGLGLAVSRRIIQAHNGSITFTSDPNEGTTFTIELPAAETAPDPARKPANIYYFRQTAGK